MGALKPRVRHEAKPSLKSINNICLCKMHEQPSCRPSPLSMEACLKEEAADPVVICRSSPPCSRAGRLVRELEGRGLKAVNFTDTSKLQ